MNLLRPYLPGDVGTCQGCRRTVRVHRWDGDRRLRTRMLVADHTQIGNRYHRHDDAICGGSRLSSAEHVRSEEMTRAAKRAQGRIALIEPFREPAGVAHDALAEGRPYPELDVWILLRIAMHEYRARIRSSGPALRIIKFKARKNRIRTSTGRADVYCTFCGVLLLLDVTHDLSTLTKLLGTASPVRAHARVCALLHLTWALQPVDPDFVKLPEELLEERCEL